MSAERAGQLPLVGRDVELARAVAGVVAAPAVVTIVGEAGIGKSRLVTELADGPELRDRRWVVGVCRQIREPFPLGPLVEALRGLGDVLAGGTLSPVAGALRSLLPELAPVLPPRPGPLDDRIAERHRVFRGLVAVLGSLGPAVLVVDDLHWADEQTVDFLGYLVANPPPALSVVLTFRGEEVDPTVRAATARVPAAVHRVEVVLAPLDAAQTGALAAATLGVDKVSDEFAAYLCQRASGLPFVIQELMALLRARGTLTQRGGSWVRKTLDELDVPAGVREPVRERVARLASPAREVVEAAAVLRTPVPAEVLTDVCGLTGAELLAGLDEGLRSGLLAEQGADIGFRHALAAVVVYDDIPGPRRRELHRRAAAGLRTAARIPLGQVAHHLWQAGQLAEWVEVAEAAADQARALGDDAEAARLLEQVLRHAPLAVDEQGRLAVKLLGSAIFSPHAREIVDLVAQIVERDLPVVMRGTLRLGIAKLIHNTSGDATRARQLYVGAVADLYDRPDLQADAMIAVAGHHWDATRTHQRTWLHRALEIVPRVDDPATAVSLLGKVATTLVQIGDPAWRPLCDQVRERASDPMCRGDAIAAYTIGMEACFAGHHDTADQLLVAGLAAAVTSETRLLKTTLRALGVVLDYCRGSWSGLPEAVATLRDELSSFGYVWFDGDVVAGCLAVAHGEQAWERLTDLVPRIATAGHVDLLPLPVAALARLAAAIRGESVPAAGLDSFLGMVDSGTIWPSTFRAVPAVTQALVVAGDVSAARQLVARCAAESEGLDVPLAPAALHHARGHLAAAAGNWREAAWHFLGAVERYEPLSAPYETAQARQDAALALFTLDDPRAEPTLRAALTTYQRLGARWDLERAASIARRHGVSLPARHRRGPRGYGADLSPREREVAELAATGRTNREIAAELFLSTHTVNKHLSAALYKLGLRSRNALARRLGGGEGGDVAQMNG